VIQGDKIKVNVDSSYFFGGAVSNAEVGWTVTNDQYFFNYQGSGYYSFTDFNEDEGPSTNESPFGKTIAQGKCKTDASGKFTIEVPADLGKVQQSQTFTIEASITDERGQQVSARANVIVNQGEFYVGIRSEEYVGTAKQPSKIDLISVSTDSKPVPGTD